MPELPEVETVRRQLMAAGVERRRIRSVRVLWPRTVEPLAPATFCARLRGRTIERVDRVGKWLVFRLDGPDNLLVHLRMTGGFHLSQGRFKAGPHDRAALSLDGGLHLHFRDPRKFGRWRLAAGPAGLGPDALAVAAAPFAAALRGRHKALKALLLDQTVLAGIGNIYADEILFAARLAPQRPASTLTEPQRRELWRIVRRILRAAVRNQGTTLGAGQGHFIDVHGERGGYREKVRVYGRAGKPCPACRRPLQKTLIAQRTTTHCPHCQH